MVPYHMVLVGGNGHEGFQHKGCSPGIMCVVLPVLGVRGTKIAVEFSCLVIITRCCISRLVCCLCSYSMGEFVLVMIKTLSGWEKAPCPVIASSRNCRRSGSSLPWAFATSREERVVCGGQHSLQPAHPPLKWWRTDNIVPRMLGTCPGALKTANSHVSRGRPLKNRGVIRNHDRVMQLPAITVGAFRDSNLDQGERHHPSHTCRPRRYHLGEDVSLASPLGYPTERFCAVARAIKH